MDELRYFLANETGLIIGFIGTIVSLVGIVAQKIRDLLISQGGKARSKVQKFTSIFSLCTSGFLLLFSIGLITNYYDINYYGQTAAKDLPQISENLNGEENEDKSDIKPVTGTITKPDLDVESDVESVKEPSTKPDSDVESDMESVKEPGTNPAMGTNAELTTEATEPIDPNLDPAQQTGGPTLPINPVEPPIEPLPQWESTSAPDSSSQQYSDLDVNAWYYDAVRYVLEREIMCGTSDTKFEPEKDLTRASFVYALYQIAGAPPVLVTAEYLDVEENAWYSCVVEWSVNQELSFDNLLDFFQPNASVTREQLALLL